MGEDIRRLVREEARLSSAGNGRWHAEYLSHAYRSAVEDALALAAGSPLAVLKTDLWNECLGGDRDILGHLDGRGGCRLFGIDRSLSVCAIGRRNVPHALVVQADIAALPFRSGALDAVLDLSTIDHVCEAGMAAAIGEYRRVLRAGGVLLVVFWQRTLLLRLRVLAKRVLGLREQAGQRYFPRARVRAALGRGLAVARELAAGVLFIAPHRLTGVLLAPLRPDKLTRFLRWLVRLEQAQPPRGSLRFVAGLHGFAAIKHREGGKA